MRDVELDPSVGRGGEGMRIEPGPVIGAKAALGLAPGPPLQGLGRAVTTLPMPLMAPSWPARRAVAPGTPCPGPAPGRALAPSTASQGGAALRVAPWALRRQGLAVPWGGQGAPCARGLRPRGAVPPRPSLPHLPPGRPPRGRPNPSGETA